MKAFAFTTVALLCFALNSVLCRMALRGGEIDATSFTVVRLVSGAAVLFLLAHAFGRRDAGEDNGNWVSALFLFGYAILFSFAYLGLTTATGALILFGSVQLTMIFWAIARGESPRRLEWVGLSVAFCGLVYLVLPGLESPPIASSILMAVAGAAWGFYTLRAKGVKNPLSTTAGNFARSLPFAAVAALPFLGNLKISFRAALIAAVSGAIASGIGYAVWYAALRFHTPVRAAVLQLAVPAIAAAGGILLLREEFSVRLLLASLLILGGIGIAILVRRK
ncbi:MAG: DMT family transporter [Acidobacteria bacterium]|nr:DMT family transporter [Acidobacteriota bacterium]MBK8151456.1 DMT family transporter [Acidobacteriota bacterium]MBK8812672.1 DMT family transporter [Acidobacteriota bacterium]